MNNNDTLIAAVAKSLDIASDSVNDDLAYNTIAEWDSVAHMALVAELENTFDIMLDTDDIIDMSSVAQIKKILKKYAIHFES